MTGSRTGSRATGTFEAFPFPAGLTPVVGRLALDEHAILGVAPGGFVRW